METQLVYLINGKRHKAANQSSSICAQPIGERELESVLIVIAHINYITLKGGRTMFDVY